MNRVPGEAEVKAWQGWESCCELPRSQIMSSPILLVEDSDYHIFLAERAFARAKVKAPLKVVTDGETAIQYLGGEEPYKDRQQNPLPSLILLDLQLPRRNGHEILNWLRQEPKLSGKRLPVVVLSTSDEPQDKDMAVQAGAVRYLVKPLYVETLVDLLQDLGLADLIEA
jgi:CheY-like chemotaxis protein